MSCVSCYVDVSCDRNFSRVMETTFIAVTQEKFGMLGPKIINRVDYSLFI